MRKTFKYRLNPTPAQRTALQRQLDCCRWVYNKALETRKAAWEERQESVSKYDTVKMLPLWKAEHEWLTDGHAQAMQEAQTRLDLAFRAFFRRVKSGEKEPGYPRFRSRDRYDSCTYPQAKGNWRLLDNGRVRLSKIGDVKIKLHRPLVKVSAKTLTIQRDAVGNWYACFSCIVVPNPLPPTNQVVGVDVGLTHFATLSDGSQIDNPRFFRKDEKALATVQRRLAKETKGTPEYRHRKRAINHVHQRIANRRRDFAHKTARKLVNEYQLIAFEDLNIIDMKDGNHRGTRTKASGMLLGINSYSSPRAKRKMLAVASYWLTRAIPRKPVLAAVRLSLKPCRFVFTFAPNAIWCSTETTTQL